MSDSNESADVTGPDLQPETPEQNEQPQATPEAPAQVSEEVPPTQPTPEPEPAADAPETAPTPTEEPDTAPPATETAEITSPSAEAPEPDTAPPATETADITSPSADAPETAPTPSEEPDTAPPATETAEITPPSADAPDTPDKPKSPAPPKSGKPGGGSKSQGRDRSAEPATPRRRPGKPPKGPSVVVRYGIMGHIGQFRHSLQPPPARGINVVIRTERGVELGEVLTVVDEEACCGGCISPQRLQDHITANGPDYPFRRDGKILRLANPQDLIDQRHLTSSATDERKFCAKELKDMKLDMKLVAVEHLLGGERIIFYFLAEHRVDFRDLVHKLANQYHTRIEMRQVGARDEARLVGDYERCGQECCCKQFLKGLQPVSMRMAKTQKATLDPSKISGRCGRLMCCLRYEDQSYRDLKKCLPHKNIWVKTADQIGRVTGTQILTQLVQVQLPDGTRGVFSNEDIIERNVDAPKAPPAPTPRPARRPERGRKPESAPTADKQQAKPTAEQRAPRPQRKPRTQPQPTQKTEPKPDPKPRATAEALDPAWGALLGDSVIADQAASTDQTPENKDPQNAQTSEQTQGSPETSEQKQPQAQTSDAKDGQKAPPTGETPRKKRRRRGRRSKNKPQGS